MTKDQTELISKRINFKMDNWFILDLICKEQNLKKHDYINKMLDNQFQDLKKMNILELQQKIKDL